MQFRSLLAAVLLAVLPAVSSAQAPAGNDALRVFLDCNFCDREYLQVETPWVAFVRDRTAGNVHLLLTSIETGGGGSRYDLEVIPQGAGARRDTVVFQTEPGATDDARRREIARNIQLALAPYALRTAAGRNLRVSAPRADADNEERPASTGPDRWKSWVFEIGGSAGMEEEERQSDFDFNADFLARRVTRSLKVGFGGDAEYQKSTFQLDEDEGETGTRRRIRESYEGGAIVVKSVGRKWGIGTEANISASTFDNTELLVRGAPAVEWSLWPYEEATRRQLVLQYSIGVSSIQYREETIFGKLSEVRPNHAFVVGFDVRQPWGSADATLEAAAFLDNRFQNRLEFDAEWNLRLFRGMELEIGGNVERIRDQLSIPKRDATPEEILLEQRALATGYRYDVRVGFSYTFGSIFSSVVNPRFGSGPGQILR